MLSRLTAPHIQQFIRENTGRPVAQLALKKNPFPDVAWTEVLNQIAARERAKDKLPTWFSAENIIFPSKISIEQTSSEAAAQYKSALVSGESLIDLTGGFGIDDYYFAKIVDNVMHCELDPALSAIAKHNFEILGAGNIECMQGDSLETLRMTDRRWDWIYIDPSRRNDAKGKVFMLKDCLPNVAQLLDEYFSYSNNVLIKTAPLLDITAGIEELHAIKDIHIVAVNNEVKELLWVLKRDYNGPPVLHAANIGKEGTQMFSAPYEAEDEAPYALPKKYLYEPNAAIMKSGAFDAVAYRYKLNKLHRHTQLYTADDYIDFPGRSFAVEKVLIYGKAEMKQLEGRKMNITTRNFPLSVEEIRKKWKIKEGGETYAFFTTNKNNEKVVLLCRKA